MKLIMLMSMNIPMTALEAGSSESNPPCMSMNPVVDTVDMANLTDGMISVPVIIRSSVIISVDAKYISP